MELADKDVQSLQSNPYVPVHMLNDPLQRTTNRNTRHTHNGACNSQASPCYRCAGKHSASDLKLNSAMCVVKLAIFQEYAVKDHRMLLGGRDTLQM